MNQFELNKAMIGEALSLPSRQLRRQALRKYTQAAITEAFGGELRRIRRAISRSLTKRVWTESRAKEATA